MPESTDLEVRVRSLERRLRFTQLLAVFFAICTIGFGYMVGHDLGHLRSSVFTDGLTVPVRFWNGCPFFNVGSDGSRLAVVLSRFSGSLGEGIRLDLSTSSEARMLFYDRKGMSRLELGVEQTGEPYVRVRDARGATMWSAPPK